MKKTLIIGLKTIQILCNNDADAVAKLIETNEDGSPNFGKPLFTVHSASGRRKNESFKNHLLELFNRWRKRTL